MIVETAPAKVNLYLHVGPLRRDGLHDLASLFVFTEDGDSIAVKPAPALSLQIAGPFAHALSDLEPERNLVWRAAALLRDACGVKEGAAIALEKNLPVAAGIGGGSADAAAALRALVKLWRLDISKDALSAPAFRLGADVPACLERAPVNVAGAGEKIERGPRLPALWVCLVNPRVETPTGPIFKAFDQAHPEPSPPALAHLAPSDGVALRAMMERTRNDLEPFAVWRAPVIGDVLAMLTRAPGAVAARMSGSGATCFGLFASSAAAERAARRAEAKGWWAMASRLHVR